MRFCTIQIENDTQVQLQKGPSRLEGGTENFLYIKISSSEILAYWKREERQKNKKKFCIIQDGSMSNQGTRDST